MCKNGKAITKTIRCLQLAPSAEFVKAVFMATDVQICLCDAATYRDTDFELHHLGLSYPPI
jgi:hypothetical protein